MGDDKISRTQLMALLWAGVMAPAAELLPALLLPGAGRGAWLAVLLAAPLVLASGWLMGSLTGEEGLSKTVAGLLGRWLGGAVLLFCSKRRNHSFDFRISINFIQSCFFYV